MEGGGIKRNTEAYDQVLMEVLVARDAVYITTIEITLELWENMADSQWLVLTSDGMNLLLEQLRGSVPNEEENQKPEDWYLVCKFFPSCITRSFWVNNGGENGEWGLWFDQITLCDLRRQNVLRCGIDLTLWAYRDGPWVCCLAWSEYWTGDRLQDLVAQLAPSPAPPTPYGPAEGSPSGEDSHAA